MSTTDKIAEYRKAIAALIGPPVVVAAGYIAAGLPIERFGTTEWFFVIAAGLGIGGLVAAVPNRPAQEPDDAPDVVGESAFFDDQDEDPNAATVEVDATPPAEGYEPRH